MKVSDRNRNEDLKKLANAFYKNIEIDIMEFGGIGLEGKRPFGNSDVPADILEIIGWKKEGMEGGDPCYTEVQEKYAMNLYHRYLIPYIRKCWLKNWASDKVAETEVKRMNRDDSYKAKLAVLLADEVFDNLSKPASEFFGRLHNFYNQWREFRHE